MKSLPLFLQSALLMPLLAPLVEFATSSSGHVEPRQGLALGWLGSVVAGLAVMFGTAERAQADPCNTGWTCPIPPSFCAWDSEGNPAAAWEYYYGHSDTDGCRIMARSCSCPP